MFDDSRGVNKNCEAAGFDILYMNFTVIRTIHKFKLTRKLFVCNTNNSVCCSPVSVEKIEKKEKIFVLLCLSLNYGYQTRSAELEIMEGGVCVQ